MKTWTVKAFRRLLAVSTGLCAALLAYAALAPYAGLCARIGLWSYPLTFIVNMGLSMITLQYIVPPEHKKTVMWPRLRAWLFSYEARLKQGVWVKIRAKGAFAFMQAATMLLSPVVGALVARLLGLNEAMLRRYVLITNLIAAIVSATLYIGAGNILATLF